MKYELKLGDCLEVLRAMPDCSVDSIVTDPPYGLSFMGKKWDYDVPSVDVWKECLRVLKPGGHLLAFAGTRTQHRMAVRIEDAGFEIRDMIAWVYGSGFPKSLDVSKAIDKREGENRARQLQFTAWMRSTGITAQQIAEATETSMASHYLTAGSQPAIATADLFDKMRPYLPEVPEAIERLVAERTGIEWTAYKNREVVGEKTSGLSAGSGNTVGKFTDSRNERGMVDITAPATEAAKQWEGWGTALKPALEPITVARKPLIGTVAANVLQHGTGAINVDGCRVGMDKIKTQGGDKFPGVYGKYATCNESTHTGRWPANLIHDGSEEPTDLLGDTARFFYCAKASKRDRDEGCDGLMERGKSEVYGAGMSTATKCDPAMGHTPESVEGRPLRRNHHPTVKPTDLMRYLCRLVTPPGGTVLDPFMGSGSTGKAAITEGFEFIGIERDHDYLEIATCRIQAAQDNKLLL